MSPLKVFKSTCSHPTQLLNTSLRHFSQETIEFQLPRSALCVSGKHKKQQREKQRRVTYNESHVIVHERNVQEVNYCVQKEDEFNRNTIMSKIRNNVEGPSSSSLLVTVSIKHFSLEERHTVRKGSN